MLFVNNLQLTNMILTRFQHVINKKIKFRHKKTGN